MKNILTLILTATVLFACKETPKPIVETKAPTVTIDSAAVAATIHNFYKWYEAYSMDESKRVDITDDKGEHLKIDLANLEKYLGQLKSSGLVSEELLQNERDFYKKCEQLWQKEEKGDIPSGMDADKFFCAQDWDINFFTQSPVRIKDLGNGKIAVTLYGLVGETREERNFELKMEGGKWVLSKVECDMGI